MQPEIHQRNFITVTIKIFFSIAALLALAITHSSASAAGFWNTQFITDSSHNVIKSPPAYDTSGNVVAAWTHYYSYSVHSSPTPAPAIQLVRSPNNGENWTTVSVRSTPVAADVTEATPVVVTDKSGNWVCIWSSNDSVGGTAGGDFDILFSRSTDAGTSWSEPQVLNSTGYNDTGFDVDPWISMDEAGNCIAVWTSDNNPSDITGTTVSQTAIWMARSSDAGQTWTPAEAITPEPGESLSEARLASNGPGAFGMAWAVRDATSATIRFAYTSNSGTTWTAATSPSTSVIPSISPSPYLIPSRGKFEPAITADSSGRWMIAWNAGLSTDSSYTDIFVGRSNDNGATWATPYRMTHSETWFPSLYTDGNGVWCIGLSFNSGKSAVLGVSRNFGETWKTAPPFPKTAVSSPSYPYPLPEGPESCPYIWKSSEAEWTALYGKANIGCYSNYCGALRIRQAKTTMPPLPPASPEWTPATSFLEDAPVPGTEPDIAANDTNTWIAVYVMPAQPGSTDTEIGFSRSTDGGRTWSSPTALNTDASFDTTIDGRPSIAASEGSSWICTWQREDGKIWQSRSLDDGKTWWPAAPVIAGGNPLIGVQPSVASLGDGQWVLAYGGSGIFSVKSTDNGLSWGAPVFVQSGWETGSCGNTSPCSSHGVGGPPRAFAAHGQQQMYVGFNRHSVSRPYGYSGGSESSESSAGHLSLTGGDTYEGNTNFSPYSGPAFRGTDEMATNGAGTWMYAQRRRYNNGPWDFTFYTTINNEPATSYYEIPDVLGRSYSFATVAMDEAGQAFRFWIGSQAFDLASFSNLVFLSKSDDGGTTWGSEQRLDTENPWGAGAPAKVRVKGSATSSFVAVWQANLPSGEPVILYSANNEQNTYTAAKDWQLYH